MGSICVDCDDTETKSPLSDANYVPCLCIYLAVYMYVRTYRAIKLQFLCRLTENSSTHTHYATPRFQRRLEVA